MNQKPLTRWQKHSNLKIKQIDFWDMQSAAKLGHESNAAYQINPTPIFDTNECAKKEVGGRGGAYKLLLILILLVYTHIFI